jgi:RNA-splicing ligase RtcB
MPVTYESNKLKSWASVYDAGTILQAEKTARLPIVFDHVSLMPDAHVGMGATVGSVIPTENAIIPAAVGVDIGCGMVATLTTLKASDLPDDLTPLLSMIAERIPAGVGKGHSDNQQRSKSKISNLNAEHRRMLVTSPPHTKLNPKQEATVCDQYGTLGSGNHFVEVCLDELDRVWTVLHSGSRGIGNQLANVHIKLARAQGQALEDKDLAYFLQGTPEFEAYIADMLWAQDYAYGNRTMMANALQGALFGFVGRGMVADQINCHHNFTHRETFLFPGETADEAGSPDYIAKDLWITRKGAIKADVGDRGVIPGSMGTRSYIVSGKGVAESWNSCSHGAGRRMSRSAAKRDLTPESLVEAMRGKVWNNDSKALLDEHPDSYKSIDQVMEDQADLVTVDAVLTQVLNYKGF